MRGDKGSVEVELVVELPELDAAEIPPDSGWRRSIAFNSEDNIGRVFGIAGDLCSADQLVLVSLANVLRFIGLIQVCFGGGGSPVVVAAQE
jgi:hypothetical protein